MDGVTGRRSRRRLARRPLRLGSEDAGDGLGIFAQRVNHMVGGHRGGRTSSPAWRSQPEQRRKDPWDSSSTPSGRRL